jgi:hypothetical protein
MYPARELAILARRKELLQAQIGLRRLRCAEAARRLAASLEVFDRWRRRLQRLGAILPLAAPFLFSGRRPRSGLGRLLKWAPLALRCYRQLRSAASGRAAASAPRFTYDGRGG